jgi:uncharacterized membrane protein
MKKNLIIVSLAILLLSELFYIISLKFELHWKEERISKVERLMDISEKQNYELLDENRKLKNIN